MHFNESPPAERFATLRAFSPFLVAANVRSDLNTQNITIAGGIGKTGDLVLGTVIPRRDAATTVIDQNRSAHTITEPTRVLAVLGPRDSSTHVCATIPAGGLDVAPGTELHWVAGESGIVGQLEREAPSNSPHRPESALRFICDGLAYSMADADDVSARALNVSDFAVPTGGNTLTTPVVIVSATSSEAGKTVLSGEIIRRLTESGMRVAAIKATGTGGVLDSLHHLKSGAVSSGDSVDGGLISTHCPRDTFQGGVTRLFRHVATEKVDVILAELGGDLVSANNPAIFQLREITDNTVMLVVVSNDALGAVGVNAFNASTLNFPPSKVRHFTSPFRNHAGMRRRMSLAGIDECYDPRSADDLDAVVQQIRDALGRRTG